MGYEAEALPPTQKCVEGFCVWCHVEMPHSVPTARMHSRSLQLLQARWRCGSAPTRHLQNTSPLICLTDAGSVMLGETGGAFTGEPPQGVDTEELAVVLFGLTFIEIWNDREVQEDQQGRSVMNNAFSRIHRSCAFAMGAFGLNFSSSLGRFTYADQEGFECAY